MSVMALGVAQTLEMALRLYRPHVSIRLKDGHVEMLEGVQLQSISGVAVGTDEFASFVLIIRFRHGGGQWAVPVCLIETVEVESVGQTRSATA